MARKRYAIYKLTSPSGRAYVGYTGQPVVVRWGQHVRRAATGAKHPLLAAIRKYGADSFVVETLAEYDDLNEALASEVAAIAGLENAYNLSPGGEHDGGAGAARFRELMSDPEWREQYLARLSHAMRNSAAYKESRERIAGVLEAWRKHNPAKAYKLSMRGLRIGANRTGRRKPQVGPERLPRKAKGPAAKLHKKLASREAAKRHWADMPPEKRAEISAKIAAATRARHAAMTDAQRDAHLAQLAEARKHIDHDVRRDRQQAALARYWGPERRREFGLKQKARYAAMKENSRADV